MAINGIISHVITMISYYEQLSEIMTVALSVCFYFDACY